MAVDVRKQATAAELEGFDAIAPWRAEWRQVRNRRSDRLLRKAEPAEAVRAHAAPRKPAPSSGAGAETPSTAATENSSRNSGLQSPLPTPTPAPIEAPKRGRQRSAAGAELWRRLGELLPQELCAGTGWEVAVARTFISVHSSEHRPRALRCSLSAPGCLRELSSIADEKDTPASTVKVLSGMSEPRSEANSGELASAVVAEDEDEHEEDEEEHKEVEEDDTEEAPHQAKEGDYQQVDKEEEEEEEEEFRETEFDNIVEVHELETAVEESEKDEVEAAGIDDAEEAAALQEGATVTTSSEAKAGPDSDPGLAEEDPREQEQQEREEQATCLPPSTPGISGFSAASSSTVACAAQLRFTSSPSMSYASPPSHCPAALSPSLTPADLLASRASGWPTRRRHRDPQARPAQPQAPPRPRPPWGGDQGQRLEVCTASCSNRGSQAAEGLGLAAAVALALAQAALEGHMASEPKPPQLAAQPAQLALPSRTSEKTRSRKKRGKVKVNSEAA